METKLEVGQEYYHKNLQIVVELLSIDGNYASVRDEQGNRITTHVTRLQSLEDADEQE